MPWNWHVQTSQVDSSCVLPQRLRSTACTASATRMERHGTSPRRPGRRFSATKMCQQWRFQWQMLGRMTTKHEDFTWFHMISLSTVTKTRELVWPWQWRKNPTMGSSMTSMNQHENSDLTGKMRKFCTPPLEMYSNIVDMTNKSSKGLGFKPCGIPDWSDVPMLAFAWGATCSIFRDAWKSSGLSMKSRDGETWQKYAKSIQLDIPEKCYLCVTSVVIMWSTMLMPVPSRSIQVLDSVQGPDFSQTTHNISDINYFTTSTVTEKHYEEPHTLTNLCPTFAKACADAEALHAEGVFSANSLTARIFTIGSPYHKGLRTRPANGLYLQSPKLLERIDAISSHYTPSNAPGTKSLTYDCLYNRFLVCRLFPAQYL